MITVVIPCYNAAKYVSEAIASVKAQTYDKWSCVIVDDGSNDGSEVITELDTEGDSRFLVVHTKNRGVAAARNLGIQIAGGGLILPFDADDMLRPNALERFAKTFEEHPDASLVVPKIHRFGSRMTSGIQDRKWCGYKALLNSCSPSNTSCFKWEDWKRVGGYRDGTMYEDWEFWIRLLYKNDIVINVPEVLVEYRVHPDSRWHKAVRFHNREVELIRKLNPEIFKENG